MFRAGAIAAAPTSPTTRTSRPRVCSRSRFAARASRACFGATCVSSARHTALALLAFAACAGSPTEALPTIAHAAPPPDAAPPDASPRACLPELASPTIALLDGDAATIHVCFSTSACFAIDRRTSRIVPFTTAAFTAPLQAASSWQPITIDRAKVNHIDLCAGPSCITVRAHVQPYVSHAIAGVVDADGDRMIVTVPGPATSDAPALVRVDEDRSSVAELVLATSGSCNDVAWVGDAALVTNFDCDGGNAHGTFFDRTGHPIGSLGPRPIDTSGAFALAGRDLAAIVAPRAYAVVLVDLPTMTFQDVIDLVPLQLESSSAPSFAIARLPDDDWIVASPTGGLGLIDRRARAMTKTWIIPRCDAGDPTGP